MDLQDNYNEFIQNLKSKLDLKKETIFLCIGTDRVIGDSIGPITGSLLKNRFCDMRVYGDLNHNLTFDNIETKINEINLKFKNPYIVAIDAALSNEQNIGKIFVDENGINIGEGLDKNQNRVGDIGVKVVVGKDYNDSDLNFKTLQNISLGKIIKLSKKISDGISIALNK